MTHKSPSPAPPVPHRLFPALALAAALLACLAAPAAPAAEPASKTFDIPAGPAIDTLKRAAQQAGLDIVYPAETVRDVTTNAVKGSYSPRRAIDLMLEGTVLAVTQDEQTGALTVTRKAPAPARDAAAPADPADPMAGPPGAPGGISGVVKNAQTDELLENADTSLADTSFSATTQRDGSFAYAHLRPGTYRLRVSYAGLDDRELPVVVSPGETTHVTVALTSSIYKMTAFTVTSEREGNAAAITEQRNALNLVNVVPLDAYGNVADNNIGTFLKRLPGVAGVGEGGDITGLSVNGAPRSWNAINIDGVRASAAYSGTDSRLGRSVVTDQLPSEDVKEVQVIHTLTPDMEADSVGGTINLVTKSGLDVDDQRLTLRAGATYNTYRPEVRRLLPAGAFSFLKRLDKGRLGLAVTGSYDEVNNARDRLQMVVSPTGINSQARTLNDNYDRLRSGASIKLNYKPSDNVELWTAFSYSYYSTQQVRVDWNIQAQNTNVADYSVVSRAQIEAGATPRTTSGAVAGIAPGYIDGAYAEFLNAKFSDIEGGLTRHARNYKTEVGARIGLPGDQQLTLKASANPSSYRFIYQTMTNAASGAFGEAIDGRVDRQRPLYVQTYGPTLAYGTDLTMYKTSLKDQDQNSTEDMLHASADYLKKLQIGDAKVQLKAGGAWRSQKRVFTSWIPSWNYVGPDGVQGINSKTGIDDDNLAQFLMPRPGYGLFKGAYPQRDEFNFPAFKAYFQKNPGQFQSTASVSAPPAYDAVTERASAAYGMATVDIGRITFLGGVRAERTNVSAIGTLSDPATPTITSISRGGGYTVVDPSAQFKIQITKGLLARLSYSSGFTRPDFSTMYPTTTVTYDAGTGLGTVSQANPSLGPQFSRDYDLSLEYYFEPVGLFTVRGFVKKVSDFISSATTTIGSGADNGFGGDYAGFNLVTTQNYGNATIKGIEINYSQQLRMLPRPFDTLTVFANLTKLETHGYYGNSTSNDELQEFIPRTTNAGGSWSIGRFKIRAEYNYQASFLMSYSADPLQRVYETGTETWDGGVSYDLNKHVGVYLDVLNLFNREPAWWVGRDVGRIEMHESFGPRLSMGVNARF